MQRDVTLIALFAAMVFLFLCNFMSLGIVGEFFSHMMFGLFGVLSYLLPVIIFSLYLYYVLMVEKDDGIVTKILAILGLLLIVCIFTELLSADMASQTGYDPAAIYARSADGHSGGGIVGGTVAYVLYQLLRGFGTVLVLLVGAAACVYALVQKSILEMARDTAMDARLHHLEHLEEQERYREEHPEEFEEEYEDSDSDYENLTAPSHYEESRQRYQELQRQRKARLQKVQEQQKMARYQEASETGSMWNTDLSADAGFAAAAPLSQEAVPETAPEPVITDAPVSALAPAETDVPAPETTPSEAKLPVPDAAQEAPSAVIDPQELPPVVIDPQEAIQEYKKAQEEQKQQEELRRRQEEEEARKQEKLARELRRNQESLHELYAEDYLDEADNEPGDFADQNDTSALPEAGIAAVQAGMTGVVTAAAVSAGGSSLPSQASAGMHSHTGGMLAENILTDPSEMAFTDNASTASSGKEEEYIPEIFEEVPGIRVIRRDPAQVPAGMEEAAGTASAAQASETPRFEASADAVSVPVLQEEVVSEAATQDDRMPSAKRNPFEEYEQQADAATQDEQVPWEAAPVSDTAAQTAQVPEAALAGIREAAPADTPEPAVHGIPDPVLPDIPVHTEREVTLQKKTEAPPVRREYVFPPISLLHKGEGSMADTDDELRETAQLLQTTLRNFGVKITITDISQGPSVTRYEMLPEMGVKVSKIVSLADDIKLALAATDIRIEAPIPGKSAIGIEVPNKEAAPVALRDIVDTEEFRTQKSKLAFAVGKDIGGKPVFGDIAKMPHVLIAGATGSGKSVCINTIIMSLLFHAKPEEVKLIMIDPKVVELSVYNGIPHLMIPVVTNPQKAAAALNWGVAEMEARYRAFADARVRDIKGYNALVRQHQQMQGGGENEAVMHFMPQLVIIVDELADLMMVAKNDVETAICRLAQLARAAGIHLIIATQRPSVDVITGLIKANMPSRIAFRVSSGVDSRTILDMNGAEKLLGKGDMLFFPQGLPKPNRVQGCFVSDDEVTDVVNFLVANNPASEEESRRHQQEIDAIEAGSSAPAAPGAGAESAQESDVDELFASAGRFIIERGNASIGLLQRKYRIGFNRAARIMDQLCEKGVVGEAVGTKARAILMTPEQFDSYCRDNGYEQVD